MHNSLFNYSRGVTLSQVKIGLLISVYITPICAAVSHVDVTYAAYSAKSLKQEASKRNMHPDTFCQVEMNTNAVLVQRRSAVFIQPVSGKLHPFQPLAWRPVTLTVSLKRYSGVRPPGLGERCLCFRTINLRLFPVTALYKSSAVARGNFASSCLRRSTTQKF